MFPNRRITTMGGDKFRDEHSLAFDGTNDYVTAGDITIVDGLDDFSLGVWVKYLDGNSQSFIDKGGYAGVGAAFGGYYNESVDSGRWRFAIDDGLYFYYNASAQYLPQNQWHHIVVTYSNTNDRTFFYFNGRKITPTTNVGTYKAVPSTAHEIKIGHNHGGDYGNQKVSEAFIYNKELSPSEARTLYNGREPYNHKEGIASGNLKAWWRMGDGQFDRNNLPATFKTGIENGDLNQYLITDASVTPSLSAEKYTATNALADLNNAEAQTGLQVREGGSTITSGTAQTASGRVEGKYAMHIVTTAATDRVSENLDDYLTKGKVYILTCVAKHAGGSGQPAAIRIADSANLDTSGDYMTIEQVSNAETGWAFYGTVFLHTSETGDQGSTEHFGIRENGSPDDAEFYISELSIKEVSGNPGVMKNMTITDFTGDTP